MTRDPYVPQAEVRKTFTFDAAHQLPNHDGKCARPHGHTYRVEVAVFGPLQLTEGAPDEGMVLDFGRIKDVWKAELEPLLDHQDLNATLRDRVWPTTAENLARWLLDAFAEHGIPAREVAVWETPTSCAIASNGVPLW